MNDQTLMVDCPTCKKTVPWVNEQQFKPFCSHRCQLIDLGDWATEAHKVPGEPVLPDFDAEQSEFED